MQKKYKKRIACALLALLFCLTCFGTVTASAETPHSVSETAEHIVFATFKKMTTEAKGNVLSAVYYVPKAYYHEEYDYGVAIIPEVMAQQYNLYGDYLERKQAEGIPVSSIVGNGFEAGNGYINIYSISGIPEQALNTRIVFAFFVRNADGEIVYREQNIASFNETTVVDPTSEDLLSIALERQHNIAMEKTLGVATQNIADLVDSVWIYLVIAVGSVAIIWGAYIGIRIIVAKRKEEQINAKGMVKRFLIGIIVMFVLAGGLPLLIKGLSAWAV